MALTIAYSWDTPCGAVDLAEEGAKELMASFDADAKSVTRLSMPGLAGPNDTLQLLADAPTWVQIGVGIAALYGAEIVKEMAKETWKQRAKIIQGVVAPIEKLIGAISFMKQRQDTTAVLTVQVFGIENGGINVPTHDPTEIAWLLSVMSRHAGSIQSHLRELRSINRAETDRSQPPPIMLRINPDGRTVEVTANEDGSVTIHWDERISSGSDNRRPRSVTIR